MTNPADHNYHNYLELSPEEIFHNDLIPSASWWQRQTIRFKTTVLAIAISTIPTLLVGSVAYYFAANSIEQKSSELRQTLVSDLQNQINIFMSDRFNDIQIMATLPIFTDSQLRNIATAADKSATLQRIQDVSGIYSSIAVFDAQGDLVAKTDGKSLGNHLNRSYIQAAIKADGAVISQPQISTSSGIFSVYTASPIKDPATGEIIGFVRARMPVEVVKKLLSNYTANSSQYYLLNNQGEIFLGSSGEYVIRTKSDGSKATDQKYSYEAIKAAEFFTDEQELFTSSSLASRVAVNTKTNREEFLTYAPANTFAGLPPLNWQAIIATDTAIVFAPQKKLRLVFMLGTCLVALGIGAIAYALANRLLRPILETTNAVQRIGRGDFATRIKMTGADEIAQLGDDINRMATQLASFMQTKTLIAQQSESLKNITLKLATAVEQSEIFDVAVRESYQTLNPDRVVYCQFNYHGTATIVAERVTQGNLTTLDTDLNPDLVAEYHSQDSKDISEVEVINNVEQEHLAPPMAEYLTSLSVKSCLIVPVVIETKLDGLLMVHKSSMGLPWSNEEIKFMTQVASQVGFAATRCQLLEQQQIAEAKAKSAQEAMQYRALSLLQEVYDVSEGDLTIRAKVTEDEIGTIADSYNSTIESLQKLVNQTKAAAIEVQKNTTTNDLAVQSLTKETIVQATSIQHMLEQIQSMEQSINLVATQAIQADDFVKQATQTINSEDQAMNRTVAEINTVQNTVTLTATKAEKLGESSQEITQAVNLISRFAAQTHLLALKASIEAARAGEQGKGFAVIADEVRSLANQSAEATAEIETIVSKIQLETSEVVEAMNQGAKQIASGSELVQQTRRSLSHISHVSNEISNLVGSITQATQKQSSTTAEVSQTMVDVAAIAENNSQSATKLSASIGDLTIIAEKLQSDISQFKT